MDFLKDIALSTATSRCYCHICGEYSPSETDYNSWHYAHNNCLYCRRCDNDMLAKGRFPITDHDEIYDRCGLDGDYCWECYWQSSYTSPIWNHNHAGVRSCFCSECIDK